MEGLDSHGIFLPACLSTTPPPERDMHLLGPGVEHQLGHMHWVTVFRGCESTLRSLFPPVYAGAPLGPWLSLSPLPVSVQLATGSKHLRCAFGL